MLVTLHYSRSGAWVEITPDSPSQGNVSAVRPSDVDATSYQSAPLIET